MHAGPTHKVRWSPDGLGFMSASEDGSVAVIRYGPELLEYRWAEEWVRK